MEGKSSIFSIVLLFIIALLALTLCALAGLILFGGGLGKSASNNISITTPAPQTPSADELAKLDLIGEKTLLPLKNTNTDTSATPPYIQCTVEIKYLIEVPSKISNIDDTKKAVEDSSGEMQELVGTYFQGITRSEAMMLDAKEKAKKVLIKEFNDLINSHETDSAKKAMIIYEVTFPYWAPY